MLDSLLDPGLHLPECLIAECVDGFTATIFHFGARKCEHCPLVVEREHLGCLYKTVSSSGVREVQDPMR